MKKIIIIIIVILVAVILFMVFFDRQIDENNIQILDNPIIKENFMILKSSAFENDQLIPTKYTCDGENINPPLEIVEIPTGTKSLVLIMDDPDAVKPAGKVWDHWVVFNIDPRDNIINEGEEPTGVQGMGSGGKTGYSGPCPPDAQHRYFFKVYALDSLLNLNPGVSKQEVLNSLGNHILAEAELIGLYNRN